MTCGELEEFVHIGLVTKKKNKISVFFVFVGQQGSLRALDYGKLAEERRIWDWWKKYYTLYFD